MASTSWFNKAASAEQQWERAVRRGQINILVKQAPFLVVVNLVNAGLIAVLVWPDVAGAIIATWYLTIAALALFPLRAWWLSMRSGRLLRGSRRTLRKAVLHAGVLGVAWAAATPLFAPHLDGSRQLILYLVLAGMAAGGAVSLGAVPNAALAFTASIASMVVVHVFALGDFAYVSLGIMLLMFFMMTGFASRSVFSSAADALRQQALAVDEKVRVQERAAQVAAESEEQFRLIAESMPIPLIIARWVDGTVIYANPQVEAMLGVSPAELVGTTVKRFYWDPVERDKKIPKMDTLQQVANVPLSMRHINGNRVDTEVSSRIITYKGERVILGSIVDVTQRRALEAELQQAQKMQAVGQLTGGIAHDFNNLLAAIIGSADMLQGPAKGNEAMYDRLVDTIALAAERGADLTRQLLAFSRKQSLKPASIELNTLVDDMVELLRRTLGADIAVETEHAAGQWSCIADPGQLQNAILNLAINARDAMPGGGRLRICTTNAVLDGSGSGENAIAPGDYVRLTVSDTGTGMPPDVVERAFEPFFTTKDVGKGTGLGLSMVYGFVKQSGGHAMIDSIVGEGSSITIYLPRAVAPAEAVEPATVEPVPEGNGETIMLVEDDANVRMSTATMLASLGYRVHSVADGPAAMAVLARGQQFDLVLSNLVLSGGMNGAEVGRRARERQSGLKLLLMSGDTDLTGQAILDVDESTPVLHKPFRRAELAKQVHDILIAA